MITVRPSLTARDIDKISQSKTANGQVSTLAMLELVITDWNLEDEKGQKLPINQETIGKLDARDIKLVNDVFQEHYKDFLSQA